MLGYLLTPLLTSLFAASDFGKITTLFSIAAFLNILYSFGMETAYFRFLNEESENKVYNASFLVICFSTLFFTIFLYLIHPTIASFVKMPKNPEYIVWVILIVALDTMAVLPFAKLRYAGRPRKFAFIKIINVIIQIALVIFFLHFCKNAIPGSVFHGIYQPSVGIGYVILANLIASGITLMLLSGELFSFRRELDFGFLKKIIVYALPLLIVGFGGMVNELIDRFVILNIYPGSIQEKFAESGIYSANYKLAIIIALFIQAFRLGAEPFFFKQSAKADAQLIYARVMKFFVITCCSCFLLVVLFLDYWKYFMGNEHPEYWTGLKVVPILLLAKIFLGIYYNLSVWYKLTNRNLTGAWITIGGVVITLMINFLLVPSLGYVGCAIATLCCYASMMIGSYLLGQHHYPVPYDLRKIFMYIISAVLLYLIHNAVISFTPSLIFRTLSGIFFGIGFGILVLKNEKKELMQLPLVGKFFR